MVDLRNYPAHRPRRKFRKVLNQKQILYRRVGRKFGGRGGQCEGLKILKGSFAPQKNEQEKTVDGKNTFWEKIAAIYTGARAENLVAGAEFGWPKNFQGFWYFCPSKVRKEKSRLKDSYEISC